MGPREQEGCASCYTFDCEFYILYSRLPFVSTLLDGKFHRLRVGLLI
jgi:hypothetical protein